MSGDGGFFARMAQRAAGREPLVRLRAPQPFEVALPDPPVDVPADVAASRPDSTAPRPAPGIPERPAAPLLPPADRRAPARAAAVVTDRSDADRTPPATPPEADPAAPDPTATPAEPAGPAGREPDTAVPTTAAPPTVTRPADTDLPPDAARPAAAVPPPPPAPAHAARRPAPAPVRAAAPDLARLLRERLGPALIARRAVEPGERLVFVDRPNRAGTPPRPGTAEVRTGPIRPAPTPPGEPPPAGDVHLHIDRVVVTRAPAPPPPPPPGPPPSTVDHAAYLARRREDR
ncbi:hypothetical protein [Micromonospora sp. MA102]|uniref:hypothetical protein n=1 Tax=Micromonospora sp. MA102 TaxID=2952755 RepID=UPI0021C57886|nr:hypothetical protein [Micromonospora sp. MA102]